jgi:IS4 transposase
VYYPYPGPRRVVSTTRSKRVVDFVFFNIVRAFWVCVWVWLLVELYARPFLRY